MYMYPCVCIYMYIHVRKCFCNLAKAAIDASELSWRQMNKHENVKKVLSSTGLLSFFHIIYYIYIYICM